MSKSTTDKIVSIVEKASTQEEVIAIYNKVKEICTSKLQSMQEEAEQKASELQSQINRIMGN